MNAGRAFSGRARLARSRPTEREWNARLSSPRARKNASRWPASRPSRECSMALACSQVARSSGLAAPSLGVSTGPSGVQLAKQFEAWGIAEQIKDRIVQAKPGVPVGALLAQGEVALGFQQLSEMRGVAGITVLGPLPEAVQITTTFSGSVATSCSQTEAMRAVLAFWASPACQTLKEEHGMHAA